jgi:predicted enzyme related to lactoylglutathione lyase
LRRRAADALAAVTGARSSGVGVTFTTPPTKIATLADREVWLAACADTEGNPLALMSEPRIG